MQKSAKESYEKKVRQRRVMKKIKNLFVTLAVLSSRAVGLSALISAILWALSWWALVCFWQQVWLSTELSIAIAVSTLLFTIPLYISSRSSRNSTNSDAESNMKQMKPKLSH